MTAHPSDRSAGRMMNDAAPTQVACADQAKFADDSCSASVSKKNRYLTARRLAQLERSLSDRDRQVLATLRRVRVATAKQLYRLHFADVTRRQARASLASLASRRLIARLPRVVGGAAAGSTGYVYTLDVAGTRLMRPDRGRPGRPWSVGRAFLDHSLAVTEVYAQLVETDRDGRLQLADFAAEPACWRGFHGPGGVRVVLKPDAALRLLIGRYEDRWWIEVDRDTESRTALARKCDLYRHYWQSGLEQSRGSGVFPRVLWLVPDEHRQSQLTSVIGKQPPYARPLFEVALFDSAVERLLQGAGL